MRNNLVVRRGGKVGRVGISLEEKPLDRQPGVIYRDKAVRAKRLSWN